MILTGRTFSAVLYGHIEILALPCSTPGPAQIAIHMPNGNSFVMENQIIEATPVWADRGRYA